MHAPCARVHDGAHASVSATRRSPHSNSNEHNHHR